MNKKLPAIFSFFFLLLAGCRQVDSTPNFALTPTIDWRPTYSQYNNETVDLQFDYPPGWTVDDSESENGIVVTSNPSLVNFEFEKYPGAAIIIFNQIDLEKTGSSGPIETLRTFLNSTIKDNAITIIKQAEATTINGHSSATAQIFGPLFHPNVSLFATVSSIRLNHRVLIVLSVTPEALTLDYLLPLERTLSTIDSYVTAPPIDAEPELTQFIAPGQPFQFDYPIDWAINEQDYPFAITIATQNELFNEPVWQKGSNDLMLTIYPNPNNQQFQSTSPETTITDFINKQLKNDFFETVSPLETIVINNHPGAERTVRLIGNFNNQKLLMDMQIIAINIADQEFLIVTLSPEHATTQFEPIIQQILESISLP